jgi:metallo-beta-lactamase family protein
VKFRSDGGAKTVTGSRHLLETSGGTLLLDCGLFQGRRKDAKKINRTFGFSPSDIDAMVLSHAHIDHSGNIPNLVKQGFKNNIFCTRATSDLCAIMLRDSAHIQEQDAKYFNKKLKKKARKYPDEKPIQPLYSMEDAERSMKYFVTYAYGRPFEVLPGIRCTFYDAGHVLGSAIVAIDDLVDKTRFVFSGDLGRNHIPILRDPEIPEGANYLAMESTYGNRLHDPIEQMEDDLAKVINTAVERGGKIIVPSFSLERTQEFVYSLHRLFRRNAIPKISVFVDSPLSTNLTEIFRLHPECYDEELTRFADEYGDPFNFSNITYIRDVRESIWLNTQQGPSITISASGMCEAGRILHHLRNNIENPKNIILFIGFQAQHTLGRRLVEHEKQVKIFGAWRDVRAEVRKLNSFSAHADRQDLFDWANKCKEKGDLKGIFLVHGDEDQANSLKQFLETENFPQVHVPERGEVFELENGNG